MVSRPPPSAPGWSVCLSAASTRCASLPLRSAVGAAPAGMLHTRRPHSSPPPRPIQPAGLPDQQGRYARHQPGVVPPHRGARGAMESGLQHAGYTCRPSCRKQHAPPPPAACAVRPLLVPQWRPTPSLPAPHPAPAPPCVQAIARIFRYGQARETFVYRMYHTGAFQYNTYLRYACWAGCACWRASRPVPHGCGHASTWPLSPLPPPPPVPGAVT